MKDWACLIVETETLKARKEIERQTDRHKGLVGWDRNTERKSCIRERERERDGWNRKNKGDME